jgi:hypothetical protein
MRTPLRRSNGAIPDINSTTFDEPLSADEEPDFAFPVSEDEQRRRNMLSIVGGFNSWKPASQVLNVVRAKKTIFIQYNRVTRVGGHPLERFGIIHGSSGHGKTSFSLGLGMSFLMGGDFFGLVDAEHTTPFDWTQALMGEHADSPGFVAMRCSKYEEVVDACDTLMKAVEAGTQPRKSADGEWLPPLLKPDATALIVVDSLKKLVPSDVWATMMKLSAESTKGSVDGGLNGRLGQLQANFNALWLLRLTPLLAQTGTTMMAIARESENVGASGQWAPKYKLQGGQAINFDSSFTVRVELAGYTRLGSSKEAPIIGERHRLVVKKTKVGQKEGRGAVAYFHMSNGSFTPYGFDRARDLLELAKLYKVVDQKGSFLTWRSCRWQGDNAGTKKLTESKQAFDMLTADVEAKFGDKDPLPVETDSGDSAEFT